MHRSSDEASQRALVRALSPYAKPVLARSLIQIITSFGPFLAACALTYWAASVSSWLAAALAVPTGALLVRIFIVQHDCGHGSFFASRWANDILGMACSVLTLVPYANWRRQHAGHHGNWNNLDRRESGADIYSACLTVAEYRALPRRERLVYRLTRHPAIAHLVLPTLVFTLLYRVPFDTPKAWRFERWTVWATDAAIIGLFVGMGLLLGFGRVAAVQLPMVVVASSIGVWLFALQHRFETTQWARQPEWNYVTAALNGSSYLHLPKFLQWLTGSIGFHNIHHLNPRVPNYRLEECRDAVSELRATPPISLWSGLTSMWLALWDEERRKLITFADLRRSARGA